MLKNEILYFFERPFQTAVNPTWGTILIMPRFRPVYPGCEKWPKKQTAIFPVQKKSKRKPSLHFQKGHFEHFMHTLLILSLLLMPAAVTRQFLSSHHIDSYHPPAHQKSHHKSPHKSGDKSLHKSSRKSSTHRHHHRLYEACSEVFGKDCGKMVQKEIKSLDKNINIKCSSGSIIVHQTIFNCIKNNYHRYVADIRATNLFQRLCHKKQKCKLNLPKHVKKVGKFLDSSTKSKLICHKTPKMWLVFSCVGAGGSNKTSDLIGTKHQHHNEACSEFADKKGNAIKKSIPSLGGWIHMKCPGGCLTIHKALWGCRYESSTQLRIVKELCQGKQVCRIEPGRRLLGPHECDDERPQQHVLELMYSCDGGNDQTKANAHPPWLKNITKVDCMPKCGEDMYCQMGWKNTSCCRCKNSNHIYQDGMCHQM